jgi:hypothetical protein
VIERRLRRRFVAGPGMSAYPHRYSRRDRRAGCRRRRARRRVLLAWRRDMNSPSGWICSRGFPIGTSGTAPPHHPGFGERVKSRFAIA